MLISLLTGKGKARHGNAAATSPESQTVDGAPIEGDRETYIWLVNQAVAAGRDDLVAELARGYERVECVAAAC